MTVPQKIRIERLEEGQTDTIGRYGDGNQFMGFVVQTPPRQSRIYAVLHTFDGDGKHLGTRTWLAGSPSANPKEDLPLYDRAQEKLDEWISELESVDYDDVQVRLFSVTQDGERFGLVDGTYTEDGRTVERIKLVPNDLVFRAPYDGSFET